MGATAMPDVDPPQVDDFTLTHDDEGRAVVRVVGSVDLANAWRLEDLLDAALDGTAGDVVVELGGVEFMDSMGLNALLMVRHRHGGRMRLGATSPRVDRLFEITGTRHLFA
jgi:anti-sigma B factor antagonist